MIGSSSRIRWFAAIAAASLTATSFAGAGCSGCNDRSNTSADTDDVTATDTPRYNDAADGRSPSDDTRADLADVADDTRSADAHSMDAKVDGGPTSDGITTPDGGNDTADASGADAADTGFAGDDTADGAAGDTDLVDDATADGDGADTAPQDTRSDTSTTTDASTTDTGDTDISPPSGLSTPCSQGPGWTLFKFHWSQYSGPSPRIDVWDASCNYSYAPNSACNVQDVRSPSFNNGPPKAILLTQSEYLRVRFSVQGLNFSKADVYVQARSYSTTASTYFRVYSPLYGSQQGGLVDNDFTYDWYHVPWTGYLYPTDDPNLTAIEIYDKGGDALAVHAVELCVR